MLAGEDEWIWEHQIVEKDSLDRLAMQTLASPARFKNVRIGVRVKDWKEF